MQNITAEQKLAVAKLPPSLQVDAAEVRELEKGMLQSPVTVRSGISRQISVRKRDVGCGAAVLSLLGVAAVAAWLFFSGRCDGWQHGFSSCFAAHTVSFLESPFVQASSLIFVSEIGDKTFFIAAVLASRASKLLTFAGCAGALVIMTVVSVAIGHVLQTVPDTFTNGLPIVDYIATASFVLFGIKSLWDAFWIESDGQGIAEEREEAEKTLTESGVASKSGWALVFEACTLTAVAEIGDRSQIATIALGATHNPFVVCFGAILGHWVATGIAVFSGSLLSGYLSERKIGIIGGVLFLVFALTTALGIF